MRDYATFLKILMQGKLELWCFKLKIGTKETFTPIFKTCHRPCGEPKQNTVS